MKRITIFYPILSIFFISLFIFTYGLSTQEIIGFDSRFYLFVLEMWRAGPTWFPTTYHQPYPDYPVTSTYLIYLAAKLFGGLNKFTAILPSALAAAITITITYLIGALQNKRWGLYAILFLFFTITFLKSARSISLDMYLTMITTSCFYLVYSAELLRKPKRIYWIFPLLVLGFSFRGPIGLVMPTGVVCIYYLINKNILKFLTVGIIASILLIMCSSVLLTIAYHVGGDSFMHDVIRMEIAGRLDNPFQPRYFYFTTSFTDYLLSFPIACLVLLGVFFYKTKTNPTDLKFIFQLLGWALIIMLGMTIPDDKKIRYILPALPAISLIAAYLFIAPTKQKYFYILRWLFQGLFLITPGIFIFVNMYINHHAQKYGLNAHFSSYLAPTLLLLQLLSFGLFLRYRQSLSSREFWIFFIATVAFIIADINIVEPIELQVDKGRAFVQRIEQLRIEQHAKLVFYKERPDGLPIKYLINMPQAEQPAFIDNQQALLHYPQPAFFVASKNYFTDLPKSTAAKFRVVGEDSLGHVPIIVFTHK